MASPENPESIDLAALQAELRAEAQALKRLRLSAQGFDDRLIELRADPAGEDAAREDAFARGPSAFASDAPLQPIAPLRLRALEFHAAPRPHPRGGYRFRDLTVFEDRAFIQTAYRALLRHGPDPRGELEYLRKLRAGRSKAETLLRLRYSAEGRTQAVRVRGLWFCGGLALLGRIPVLGAAARWLVGLARAPFALQRSLMQQEQLRQHLNQSLLALQEKTNESARTINRILRELDRD